MRRHIPYTNGLLAAINKMAPDDGVFARARGDGDFDAWVLAGEEREFGLEESAR